MDKKPVLETLPNTRICPVCKKEFIMAPEHIYKIKTKTGEKKVCSWHCVRDWEKQHEN